MIRRPPRSTLFPYTSSSDLRGWVSLKTSVFGTPDLQIPAGVDSTSYGNALRLFSDHASCSRIVGPLDRKSTRLNSSHGYISYAVFCLKKKIHVTLYRAFRMS